MIILKNDPFQFKETVILVNNTVQQEMLTEATFNQTNFYFSFMLYKILALIFNMFIYVKIRCNQMHSDFYRSTSNSDWYFILATGLKLQSIYRAVYMQTGVNRNLT